MYAIVLFYNNIYKVYINVSFCLIAALLIGCLFFNL